MLTPGDLLVFNDTKVIPARLLGTKPTGGAVEVLLVKPLGGARFEAMARGKLRAGMRVAIAEDFGVRVDEVLGGGFHRVTLVRKGGTMRCRRSKALRPYSLAAVHPPRRQSAGSARVSDDVRDPRWLGCRADRRFCDCTPAVIERLRDRGIRYSACHVAVGPGTFLPVREEAEDDITKHTMHSEWYRVSEKNARRRWQRRNA